MAKQYSYGSKAREDIEYVAKEVGDVLGKTLGKAGRNYFIPTGITNDGRTIVKELEFATDGEPDECRNDIAAAFEEVALRQDQDSGDGTTTAIVLATKMVQDLLPKVSELDVPMPGNMTVMEISHQLEEEEEKAKE